MSEFMSKILRVALGVGAKARVDQREAVILSIAAGIGKAHSWVGARGGRDVEDVRVTAVAVSDASEPIKAVKDQSARREEKYTGCCKRLCLRPAELH